MTMTKRQVEAVERLRALRASTDRLPLEYERFEALAGVTAFEYDWPYAPDNDFKNLWGYIDVMVDLLTDEGSDEEEPGEKPAGEESGLTLPPFESIDLSSAEKAAAGEILALELKGIDRFTDRILEATDGDSRKAQEVMGCVDKLWDCAISMFHTAMKLLPEEERPDMGELRREVHGDL